MFSVAVRENVSCPNCYVKSSSRCFYDPLTQLKSNASRPTCCRPPNESEPMEQVMQLPKGIVCLHSIIKQNDLITPEYRLYDDGSAAASSII